MMFLVDSFGERLVMRCCFAEPRFFSSVMHGDEGDLRGGFLGRPAGKSIGERMWALGRGGEVFGKVNC